MALRSEVIDRQYLFEHDLGWWNFGAMGVLKDRTTGALKTCKTVNKALLMDSKAVLTRLRKLQELKHSHVSTVVEVLEDQRSIFIISDKLRGGDIDNWLNDIDETTHWLAEETCAAYIGQALVALAHCHSIGVYHHDLRPGNIMLTSKLPDAVVQVSDFGLASILDPESVMLKRNPSPYAAPELLSGSRRITGGAPDMWSIGAIARALLIGRKPEQDGGWNALTRPLTSGSLAGVAHSFGITGLNDVWADRSPASRDFVERLLQPAGDRPTAARMLQHPWLRCVVIPSINDSLGADYVMKDIHQKTLCYVLATLLAPGLIPHPEMHQLRQAFVQADTDYDGLVTRRVVQDLLKARGVRLDQAAAALSLADVRATGVIDLCAATVALVVARTLLKEGCLDNGRAEGPSTLEPKAASARLLECLFEIYGSQKPTVMTAELSTRLRTATGRELEEYAGVSYDDVLSTLPEDCAVDRRALVSGLQAGGGCGTPLCFGFGAEETADHDEEDYDSCWEPSMSLKAIRFFLTGALRTCGVQEEDKDKEGMLEIRCQRLPRIDPEHEDWE